MANDKPQVRRCVVPVKMLPAQRAAVDRIAENDTGFPTRAAVIREAVAAGIEGRPPRWAKRRETA